jgi:hypothetical protein
VVCIQWGHLSNTRPGKIFLHVEYPRPPPPRGSAAVLVLVGKCGNGHGKRGHAVVILKSLGVLLYSDPRCRGGPNGLPSVALALQFLP